ncbi:hypothetical protein PQX77_017967 [Marasmius sp. AFHP31]|nr:hypothetical protein PQX77_017967 [Marasmius sp. AFHP31]
MLLCTATVFSTLSSLPPLPSSRAVEHIPCSSSRLPQLRRSCSSCKDNAALIIVWQMPCGLIRLWLNLGEKPRQNTQSHGRETSLTVINQEQADIEQCYGMQPPGGTYDTGLGTQVSTANTQPHEQEPAIDDIDQRQVDIEQGQGMQPPQVTHDTGLGTQASTQSTPTLATQVSTQNTNTGSGSQNNNNLGTQNIHYGDGRIGQVSGGEVNLHFNAKGFKGGLSVLFSTIGDDSEATLLISGLKRLSDAIAGVGASHKAEHQFSRGECLEGTRKSARTAIHDWASAKGPEALPVCWLSGAAGVGKSAIALTIAKVFEAAAILTSSFFFFRSDPRRNNPATLMLTIAHGLATAVPLMRDHIEQRISTDPTILEASLEEQFRELVTLPAVTWSKDGSQRNAPVIPSIIIIDGLDECGDEETQLRILSIIQSAYQQTPHLPLRFLICSRPEAWIQEAFSDEYLSRLSRNFTLDNSLEAREDVRRYYIRHFHEITTSQKYRQVQFPSPWPSVQDLDTLVERSCAQFVYATTSVKFIKLAGGHPIIQLLLILQSTVKVQPSRSPYCDLDCLYQVILSANPIQDELILILVAILILPKTLAEPTPAVIEGVLGLPSGQVDLTLRGMYSVLKIGGWKDEIELYHTSFRDYLLDHTRSGIDIAAQKHIIACRWLQGLSIDRLQGLRYGLSTIFLSACSCVALTHSLSVMAGFIVYYALMPQDGYPSACQSLNLLRIYWITYGVLTWVVSLV